VRGDDEIAPKELTMRRTLTIALSALCLAAGSASAAAPARTVNRSYQPAYVEPGGTAGSIHSSNGVAFRTRANERFVTVTIEDASGLPIPARVAQDVDGDREDDVAYEFCGSTAQPVAIQPGVPVTVWMSHGTCDDVTNPSSGGGWTTGTVTATFSRR
jgi:hypothetical protein